MATAYVPLANITLGSSAASVTFSSISQAYRDLILIYSAKASIDSYSLISLINNDSGSNYSRVRMTGNGSTAVSSSNTDTYAIISDESSTTTGATIMQFMDYSATDKHKTILSRGGTSAIGDTAVAVRWANTAAITTFKLTVSGATWSAGSTFALYGIAA